MISRLLVPHADRTATPHPRPLIPRFFECSLALLPTFSFIHDSMICSQIEVDVFRQVQVHYRQSTETAHTMNGCHENEHPRTTMAHKDDTVRSSVRSRPAGVCQETTFYVYLMCLPQSSKRGVRTGYWVGSCPQVRSSPVEWEKKWAVVESDGGGLRHWLKMLLLKSRLSGWSP